MPVIIPVIALVNTLTGAAIRDAADAALTPAEIEFKTVLIAVSVASIVPVS